MKKELCCLLSSSILCACATANSSSKTIKIAQAIKKEGDAYQIQGKYTAALAKLLEAEKIIPRDPYLQNSLGLAYMGKKRYDLAESSFTMALKYKPEYTDAKNNMGVVLLRQQKWDQAITRFLEVLDDLIYPTPHFALANLGWAYLGKAQYAKAQTYFLKALETQSGFITAIHGLAQVYIQTRQTTRALKYLQSALKQTPDSAILHADLAQVYEQKGLREQALRQWQLTLRLVNTNTALARKAQDRILTLE